MPETGPVKVGPAAWVFGTSDAAVIKEPVIDILRSPVKARILKENLGSWATEAYDEKGRFLVPVLRAKAFRQYLIKHEGVLTGASGICPTAGSWVQLMYALGIGPGMRIIDWRRPSDDYVHIYNGGIMLDMDGEVLCHIVNLYKKEDLGSEYHKVPRYAGEGSCTLSFGHLQWAVASERVYVLFKPGSTALMSGTKLPFNSVGLRVPSNLMKLYFTTLEHGISDLSLLWHDPCTPFRERTAKLLTILPIFTQYDAPLLVSHLWLRGATQVKRDLLGSDGKVVLWQAASQELDRAPIPFSADDKMIAQTQLRKMFFFEPDGFRFVRGMRKAEHQVQWDMSKTVTNAIRTFRAYRHGTWERDVYELRDKVQIVLAMDIEVKVPDSAWVLAFERNSSLWNTRCRLGGST